MSEDRSGYVYILKASKPFEECYKIGRTAKPRQRLTDFAVRLPYEFEVVFMRRVDDCHQAERHMHDFFAAKRLEGEWFRLDALDLELVRVSLLENEAAYFVSGLLHNIVCQTDEGYVAKLQNLLPKAWARRRRRKRAHAVVYEQWKARETG